MCQWSALRPLIPRSASTFQPWVRKPVINSWYEPVMSAAWCAIGLELIVLTQGTLLLNFVRNICFLVGQVGDKTDLACEEAGSGRQIDIGVI